MLLIGSQAIAIRAPELLLRKPRDWDFICLPFEFDQWIAGKSFERLYQKKPGRWVAFYQGQIYEFELAENGNTGEQLYALLGARSAVAPEIVDPEVVLALKLSHRYLKNSPHFLKTMRQIQKMRAAGYKMPEFLQGWFKRREKETYNYSKPNLNQGSKTFFNPNQGIKYIYDHDSIHVALARDPLVPAYSKFKDDLAEVKVSKEKFLALDEETKLNSVLEESYVLALERSQIPYRGVLTPRQSFLKALEKVCTSISSGWWREWAWENYDAAVARYDGNYVRQFEEALKAGIVKPFAGEVRHMENSNGIG